MSTKEILPVISSLSQANNHLAVQLHKLLNKTDDNVFFSPFSLSTALAMLFCGTESQTATEMRSVLGYKIANLKEDEVRFSFQLLLEELEKNPEFYTLACANSMVSHQDFRVKEEFKLLMVQSFKALLKEVNFVKESEKAVLQINEWIKEKTNGMIPQLLSTLDPSTVMVLVNAVYFKGAWVYPFEDARTCSQSFYNLGDEHNAKQVDMMHITRWFPFVEKDSFKALVLPYKGEDIAMLILLPKFTNGLAELEDTLSPGFIQDLNHDLRSQKVDVALPKFRLEYSKTMKEYFQILGMKLAFTPEAHFGLISNCKNLCISEIIHKAVLEVNETGTVAAAATAIMGAGCCFNVEPDPEFIVDHPFAFIVYNTKNNLILFMGRINKL